MDDDDGNGSSIGLSAADGRVIDVVGQLNLQWQAEVGRVVLHLSGDLDGDAVHDLTGVAVVAGVDGNLVVDLSAVTFIDIAGLRLLEALAGSGTVRYRAPSAAVERLLTVLGERQALPLV